MIKRKGRKTKRESYIREKYSAKRLNKTIAYLLMGILIFSTAFTNAVSAEEVVTVELNGEVITFNEDYGFPFIDENDRTQVPFRLTMETFGAEVLWDEETFTASAVFDGIRVDIPIGEQYILRDGEIILNDTTSRIINDRTYLPIRVVFEAFGADISWEQDTYTVMIDYQEDDLLTLIPTRLDLRETDRLTPVKNQFDTGACWAFASYGAMESELLPDALYDFSEDHLSLGHGFNLEQADGGNAVISLSYLTRWSGPVLEVEDPFNDGVNNPEATVVKHVQEVQFIPAETEGLTPIKVALMSYGPVQTSIFVDSTSLDGNNIYYNELTSAYYYFGGHEYNHDVVIVGWDDSYPKENFKTEPEEEGAFIVRNSYGEEFGEAGYFYISYSDIHIGKNAMVFTDIQEVDNYANIYQSDWLGYIGQIGYGDETAYFSNVYETDSPEILDAVSFYATDVNSTYEVYVVESFESADDFENMTMIERGGFDFGGYYTIDFEVPIVVEGRFAVVVRITTPDSQFPVAAEFMKDLEWLNTVNITDGEGYMSYDGSYWERTETVLGANTCLKAFTHEYDVTLLDQGLPADQPLELDTDQPLESDQGQTTEQDLPEE